MNTETGVLSGRHAVVTGGGRGIGAAVASALAVAGATLTLMGRNLSPLQAKAAALPASQAIACDVTDEPAVAAAFAQATLARTSLELFRQMLDVNLVGTFLCSRAVLPGMLGAGFGRIVNVASVAGLKGAPYITAYAAAKHGVIGLTRALALETASKGITVNAVCPNYTDTDMVRSAVANIVEKTGRSAAEAEAALVEKNPQGRLVRPDEVAATVLWLCAPGTEAITGQAIAIAGGEV